MSQHDGYKTCPNCTHDTAMNGKNGELRCIPCGYGLPTINGRLATPEQSARNARLLRGD